MVPFLFCSFGNILGFSSFGYCCDFCPTRSVLFVPWYLRYSVSGGLSIIDCVAFRKSQNLSPICFYTSERVSWRELALWWCYGQSVVMHCSWLSGMQEAAIVLRGKNQCRQLLVKASGRPWLLASWLHLFYKYGGASDSSWKMCIVEKKTARISKLHQNLLIPLSHEHFEVLSCLLLSEQGLFALHPEISRLWICRCQKLTQSNRKGKRGPRKKEVWHAEGHQGGEAWKAWRSQKGWRADVWAASAGAPGEKCTGTDCQARLKFPW